MYKVSVPQWPLPVKRKSPASALRRRDHLLVLEPAVDGLAGAAILLQATCRPGYRVPWLDKSYATQIALQPLDPEDTPIYNHPCFRSLRRPDRCARSRVDVVACKLW
jgi:hypothetical protein